MAKKILGRGLDALLSENSIDDGDTKAANAGIVKIRLSDIEPNRSQARKKFDTTLLTELASSISRHGVIQPIVVRRKQNGFYEIIAGERRWRASKMAGLSEIPVIIKDVTDPEAAELSLIENLQRENLNPVEEALGYKALMDAFDLTHEEAAEKVGKSRASVTNLLRILKLPTKTLDLVSDGLLSAGHARTLVPLTDRYPLEKVTEFCQNVADSGMSVRETERYVKTLMSETKASETAETAVEKSYIKQLQKRASSMLGRSVVISGKSGGKGCVKIAYNDTDDFERLLKALCGDEFFDEL